MHAIECLSYVMIVILCYEYECLLVFLRLNITCYSSFLFQMDSSSTPNVVSDNNNDFEGEEEQEYLTPNSRGKRKESPEASGATFQTQKAPRYLPPRSKIWGHFTRTTENRDRCICHYCNKTFCCATRSGTSNLMKHLSICKRFMFFSEGQSSTQPGVNEEGQLKSRKISESTFREATNEMMVIAELPLSFIEGVGWKHLCDKVSYILVNSIFKFCI